MPDFRIDENLKRLSEIVDAVCYWLGYQSKIGRDHLIHEASLRYPIADTITAKGIKVDRIVLEKLHPLFKSRKIDLVVYDKDIKELEDETNDLNLLEVFEFKLAKRKTGELHSDEHQRVFDDIVRLAYYHMWAGKDCYFLMCGRYQDFKAYFVGQKNVPKVQENKNIVTEQKNGPQKIFGQFYSEEWKTDGLYKDWFGFEIEKTKTVPFKVEDSSNWGLRSFQKTYEIRDNDLYKFSNSITVKTTCMAITPAGENNRTHAAGIWRIESVQ